MNSRPVANYFDVQCTMPDQGIARAHCFDKLLMMANDAVFSTSYAEARRRFIDAARAAGAQLGSYAIDAGSPESLTIDVAIVAEPGTNDAPALVISSGVHGIEGFFGSAVQLALLQRIRQADERAKLRYVLIHAVNPFGFAHLRRVNEDNVDLNRNFLSHPGDFAGAPAGYARLNGLLNPPSSPSRWEPFHLKALWQIARIGLQPLKEAVASGQYEYPQGLFFGGKAPCAATRIVQQNCDDWLGGAPSILHLDLHTGLGPMGTHTLLLNEAADHSDYRWYANAFGADRVEPLTRPAGTAYKPSGTLGQWMQRHCRARVYRFAGAEFGTYDVIRVLSALRAENRAHHYCTADAPAYQQAKQALLECFCPASPPWRRRVVDAALHIIDQGVHAIGIRSAPMP
jgi:hypothetical protein